LGLDVRTEANQAWHSKSLVPSQTHYLSLFCDQGLLPETSGFQLLESFPFGNELVLRDDLRY
jgi:hypothetical protein